MGRGRHRFRHLHEYRTSRVAKRWPAAPTRPRAPPGGTPDRLEVKVAGSVQRQRSVGARGVWRRSQSGPQPLHLAALLGAAGHAVRHPGAGWDAVPVSCAATRSVDRRPACARPRPGPAQLQSRSISRSRIWEPSARNAKDHSAGNACILSFRLGGTFVQDLQGLPPSASATGPPCPAPPNPADPRDSPRPAVASTPPPPPRPRLPS